MDGRKLAPGPNQLAGLLGKVPDKTKGQVLDLQNRPAAFYQGSQATRRLAGRDVAISAPFLASASGRHDPSLPVRKQSEDSPQRMTTIPEHIPTPQNAVARIEPKPTGRPDTGSPEAPAPSPRPSLHRQDSRPHVDPGLENLHLSQPGNHFNPPPAYSQKPPPGHKTTETGPGVHEELPVEDEKKMSLGKKVMMGVGGAAALLGITFLMSTPTPPPPPPEKST